MKPADRTGRVCLVPRCPTPTGTNHRQLCHEHFSAWVQSVECAEFIGGLDGRPHVAARLVTKFCERISAEEPSP